MIPFEKPTLENADVVKKIVAGTTYKGSELSFANIYLLRNKYGNEIAVEDEMLFRYYTKKGARIYGYGYPIGCGNEIKALECIEQDAKERGRRLDFALLTHEQKEVLEQWKPESFSFTTDDGDKDYIYEQKSLACLVGKKYRKKRNHISQFNRQYDNWHFEKMSDANKSHMQAIEDKWFKENEGEMDADLQLEQEEIREALENSDCLGMIGGVLYIEQKPVAMTLASMIQPNVCDIHFEKTVPDYRAAYPMINQEMAKTLEGVLLINREEDVNVPGLRKAKESYYPIERLVKYNGKWIG